MPEFNWDGSVFNADEFNAPTAPAEFRLDTLLADCAALSIEISIELGVTAAARAWKLAKPHIAHVPAEFALRVLVANAAAIELDLAGAANFVAATAVAFCGALSIALGAGAQFALSTIRSSSSEALVMRLSGGAQLTVRIVFDGVIPFRVAHREESVVIPFGRRVKRFKVA